MGPSNKIAVCLLCILMFVNCKRSNDKYIGNRIIVGKSEVRLDSLRDNFIWIMYCYHCDWVCKYGNRKENNYITCGEADLKVNSISYNAGLLNVFFTFENNGQPLSSSDTLGRPLLSALIFNMKGEIVNICRSGWKVSYEKLLMHSNEIRIKDPIQPEVLYYLNRMSDRINSGFKRLAISRRLLS